MSGYKGVKQERARLAWQARLEGLSFARLYMNTWYKPCGVFVSMHMLTPQHHECCDKDVRSIGIDVPVCLGLVFSQEHSSFESDHGVPVRNPAMAFYSLLVFVTAYTVV
ncbi:hypothetical protein Tco_1354277 [Tanacetum coccineum]